MSGKGVVVRDTGEVETRGEAVTARARAARLATARPEVLGLAGVVVLAVLLPGSVPLGQYGLGVTAGGLLALQAIGLVLVYRSNRIVNFAQVAMGSIGGLLFAEMVRHRPLVEAVHYVCRSCVPVPDVSAGAAGQANGLEDVRPGLLAARAYDGWLVDLNFWAALLVSLAVVVGLVWVAYHLVVKRFSDAPRLVLTIVTIGLAQVFLMLRSLVPKLFGDDSAFVPPAEPPFSFSFELEPAIFRAPDILQFVTAVVAVVLLARFFRRSTTGVVLRGAADDHRRAETLGVNVNALTSRVWMVAALLSGLAAAFEGMSLGASTEFGAGGIVRILAAGVMAGMTSLPLVVAGSVAIGVLDRAVLWTLDSSLVTDGMLFLVVVAVLLVQRRRTSRVDTDSDGSWKASREMRPIPAELRDLPAVRRWVRGGTAAAIGVALLLPWVLSPSQINVAAVTATYAIVGLSLLVLTGWAGQISLGQFGFAAVGAYTAARLGWPFPFDILSGALAGALAATAVGLPALRLRGLHLAITTLAFAAAVPAILLNPRYLARALPDTFDRPVVLGLDLADQRTFFYFALLALGLAVVATLGMRRSRTARVLVACRDNEAAAQSLGVNLLRTRLSAFAVSGFMAAAAGVVFAYAQFTIVPVDFRPEKSIAMFLMVVIGGLGAVTGPLIGALYLGVVTLMSGSALVQFAATGLGTVVLLTFMPGGLGQVYQQARDAALRRVADRHRIHVPSLVADGVRADGDSRVPIAPKVRPGGGTVFVPDRYRLERQWLAGRHRDDRDPAEEALHG